jgi:uncharacterized protein YciI
MKFDQYTIVLLILNKNRPKLTKEEEDKLQDVHLAYLAKLHDEGHLLMAGPILGSLDRDIRGLNLFKSSIEEAKSLAENDPAVRGGKFTIQLYPWMVPSGAANFTHTKFPRSMMEV